jgi:hypothetical protein
MFADMAFPEARCLWSSVLHPNRGRGQLAEALRVLGT